MRVLAVDPSLRGTGYAVLEAAAPAVNGANARGNTALASMPLKARACGYGTIKNKADLLPSSCLVAIHDRLAEIIHEYEPDCCAIEGIIFVQSYKTAITMGAARGAAILAAAERGLPVFEYSPREVKQAVVGRGGAEKTQVAFMVRALLGLTETPAADAADALAIGLTHLREQTSPLRKLSAMSRI